MKKLFFISLLAFNFNLVASDKIYIDEKEMCSKSNAFYLHRGNNIWISTPTVHRDETGLYTYETDIRRSLINHKTSYEQKWKCPYCYQYWPRGTRCQNSECPSKYK